MRCVLHIGTEKTATTSIQSWLYQNKATLSRNGIALSHVLGEGNNRALCARFQPEIDDYLLDMGIRDEAGKKARFATFLDDFEAEIRWLNLSHTTMIITSEHFHRRMTSEQNIAELRDFLYRNFSSIQIVCYFREQSEVRKSLYSTGIKGGDTCRIQDFQNDDQTETHYYNYKKMLDKWSACFGKSCITRRIFRTNLFPDKDIRKDFLNICRLKIPSDSLDFSSTHDNKGLTRFQALLARQVNKVFPRYNRNGKYSWIRDRAVYVISSFRMFRLGGAISDPRQKHFYAAFNETNKDFFYEYFGVKENLFSAPLPHQATETLFSLLSSDPATSGALAARERT
ncbi:hypothetical protein [Acetobacter oeni]|nr:hypothetical protein [Acetobacter oeni]MBB3882415.1 hypothetical protein [Acetobacter oeni]NHO18488.1 hypothetical protein [Acetobacter oeni]GBR00484.1 hypothetical protein AA21952_0116 [Acetobacter oeni LMG 21952]